MTLLPCPLAYCVRRASRESPRHSYRAVDHVVEVGFACGARATASHCAEIDAAVQFVETKIVRPESIRI